MQPNPHVCICAQFPFTVVCKIKTLQICGVKQSLLSSFYPEHLSEFLCDQHQPVVECGQLCKISVMSELVERNMID